MSAIIIFILILGVLVFVHELGHFVTARRNGIKCHEFGFGFPPRAIGIVKDSKLNKWFWIKGNKQVEMENTIYSLNWIPIGGFVKIKGEDGGSKVEEDSFAHKGAWVRTKVLAAGVMMNFVLAWFLITVALTIGAPEAVDPEVSNPNAKIQIAEVFPGGPADQMGLKVGDEIARSQISSGGEKIHLDNIKNVQDFINSQKGREITLQIERGKENLTLKGTPREQFPEGQGPLGISLAETKIVAYPWYQAIWKALVYTTNLIVAILTAFWGLLSSLFVGQKISADIAGPVGIAILTKQVAGLGFVYVLQFAALLSINLGIINILPIPALDGGRILFVLIEKVKGSPVSQKVEQAFHTVFFMLLILLMIIVTFKDVSRFFVK